MLKKIILFISLISISNAFEIRSWNMNELSNDNLKQRNIPFLKLYTNEIYDVMCIQNLKEKGVLEKISDLKNYYYSNDLIENQKNNSYFGWIIKQNYKNNEVVNYVDSSDFKFKNNPSMLLMKDINIGIINVDMIFDQDKSKELYQDTEMLTKLENRKIVDVVNYFSKTYNLEKDRLFVCGNFNLSAAKIKRETFDIFFIGNNEGSTMSERYGYTNFDTDHIISSIKGKVTPDYDYLNKWGNDFKNYMNEISTHLPIKGEY